MELENPMVMERFTLPRSQVCKVRVTATITAEIEIPASCDDDVACVIDGYADSVMAEADGCEIDDWEIVSVEETECDYGW